MTAFSTSPQFQIDADARVQDVERHRAVLNKLIEIGADMARLVHQHAKSLADAAPPDDESTPPAMAELGVAFDRIARAVRRSILLARRLGEAEPAVDPARPRLAARQRILRVVEDAIERGAADHEAAGLHAELIDRLDGADLDDEIDDRPVADIIADICRDLGLAAMPGVRAWKRRTPADLALLRARAASVRPAARAAPPGAVPPPPEAARRLRIPECHDP